MLLDERYTCMLHKGFSRLSISHQQHTMRKLPQPAMSDLPMATRLCCLKRRRMLQQVIAPGAPPGCIALGRMLFAQPTHRSVSHSWPAQCHTD